MRSKLFLFLSLVVLMLMGLSACFPIGVRNTSPDIDATVAAKVAIDFEIQTKVAETVAAAGLGAQSVSSPTNTIEQPPTATGTPTLTPTITLTPTPEAVTLVLSEETNCREGGSFTSFQVVVPIKPGQIVKVISRNPEDDSYYVENPYEAGSQCWVWGRYATVTGDVANLPVSTMHPTPTPTKTPTPAPVFTVSYTGLETCGGQFAFKLFIRNTGGSIWQYYNLFGSDAVTGFVVNQSSNKFTEYSGCVSGMEQGDLAPGEASYVLNTIGANPFNYDPTGHLINITVTLCTADGGGGSCKSIPISFTP